MGGRQQSKEAIRPVEEELAGRRKAPTGIVRRVEQTIRDQINAMPAMVTHAEAATGWKVPPALRQ